MLCGVVWSGGLVGETEGKQDIVEGVVAELRRCGG